MVTWHGVCNLYLRVDERRRGTAAIKSKIKQRRCKMAYTRMNPLSVFDELRREIGRLFDGYGPGLGLAAPFSARSQVSAG